MTINNSIIQQTQKWIQQVVVKNNFCPFAAAEVAKNAIHYEVYPAISQQESLQQLVAEWLRLDQAANIATTLLIFPDSFKDFMDFLDLVNAAQALLVEMDYEGIYQLASFHPEYCFAGSNEEDPANYTNRSPYPMLHILREASVEKALKSFPHPERIPEKNIALSQKLGIEKMKAALAACRVEKD